MNILRSFMEGVIPGKEHIDWTKRFHLAKNPFKDTLDSELFFRTSQHEEALIKILIAINDRHALILLSGASGTGKTMVSQIVLRNLERTQYLPLFLFVFPGMSRTALLGGILEELGQKDIPRTSGQQLSQFQDVVLSHYEKGRRVIIVIDEAHFLKADALHLLRTLSNLETEKEKLVTVLLIGEDSLKKRLDTIPSYMSLRSRITFAVTLSPLNLDDTEQYIKYRLLKCKAPSHLLRGETFSLIHDLTKGVPRDINRLLYNSFIEAMAANATIVTTEILLKAAAKLGLNNAKKK